MKDNKKTVMDDPYICTYITDLLRNIRSQVLLKILGPYTRVRIPYISQELNVPSEDVESLLVSLILDNKIKGHIDQINQIVILDSARSAGYLKYQSLGKWATQLKSLERTVMNRIL